MENYFTMDHTVGKLPTQNVVFEVFNFGNFDQFLSY